MQEKKDSKKMGSIKDIDSSSEEIDTLIEKGKKIFMSGFKTEEASRSYIKKLKIELKQELFFLFLFFLLNSPYTLI